MYRELWTFEPHSSYPFSSSLSLLHSFFRSSIPFNISHSARLAQTWRTTPTKWYPIPVLLGAFVLIGIQARRNYVQDKKALENGGRTRGGKIVDENGHVVTMQGPWTVSDTREKERWKLGCARWRKRSRSDVLFEISRAENDLKWKHRQNL